MNTSTKLKLGTLVLFVALGVAPITAIGQAPSASTPAASVDAGKSQHPTVREEFRSSMKEFQSQLERLANDVDGVSKKLESQSSSSIESRKVEVDAMRQQLMRLGAQIQPDAPLVQNVDRFQSWITAQLGRINGQRPTLGAEFVEGLIKRYQQYQQEVTTERENIETGQKAIDSLLRELTMAEFRISELLLADDTAAAVKELQKVVSDINRTIEGIRTKIRQTTGSAGA